MNDLEVSACAPTGIAAARIRILRTPVKAFTLHYLFALDVALESKLDPTKPQDERQVRLAKTQVLFTDEASMIVDATWLAVKGPAHDCRGRGTCHHGHRLNAA